MFYIFKIYIRVFFSRSRFLTLIARGESFAILAACRATRSLVRAIHLRFSNRIRSPRACLHLRRKHLGLGTKT